MPALPIVPDVVRVRMKWTTGGPKPVYCRFYLGYTGSPPAAADCIALADEVEALWVTNLKSQFHSSVILTEVDVVDLGSTTGSSGSWTGSSAGSLSGTAALVQTPVHLKFAISRRYRGGKPGVYMPALNEAAYTDPYQWNTVTLATFVTDAVAFFDGMNGFTHGSTDWTFLVSVSYYEGFTVVTDPVTGRARNLPTLRATPVVDPVNTIGADDRISSQRRRRGPAG